MRAAMHERKTYHSVMVSSTFTDLEVHRDKLIEALHRFCLMASAMEHAVPGAVLDIIDSSLQMVRDAAAYIGVISRKYGQTPACPGRNPNNLSANLNLSAVDLVLRRNNILAAAID